MIPMVARFVFSWFALLIGVSDVCAQTVKRAPPVKPGAADKRAPAAVDPAFSESALFRPGDTFDLNLGAVPLEAEPASFNKTFTIGGDGFVNVPYAGQVQAAGLTQSQLERAIQTRLIEGKIFRWPTITITVPERARLITVGGQVRAPQRIYWSADMTVMSALNAAGGPAEFAGDKIRVTREKKLQMFSRKRLLKKPEEDPRVFPGDQIELL